MTSSTRHARAATVFAIALLATPAAAQIRAHSTEIGAGAGYQLFGEQENLDHAPYFVLRLSHHYNAHLGAELGLGYTPSQLFDAVGGEKSSVHVIDTDLNVIYELLDARFTPFGVAGMGLRIHSDNDLPSDFQTDLDWAFFYGVGVRYALTELVGLRFDVRHHLLRDAPPYERQGDSDISGVENYFNHLIFALSVTFQLGGTPPDEDGDGLLNDVDKCRTEPEDKDGFEDKDGCPDPDNDGDGILDADDQCPGEAEDKDDFEDADGCPDPDNDTDGIPDASDKCPNEKETINGVSDEDGCPEGDKDGDGVVDGADKCPDEAEDADGFEDTDGCPEPDNDKDGLLDAVDKCPIVAETANGYLDDDGCPDEVPAELAEFSGTVEGIEFETGKAQIKPESLSKLKKAVRALKKHSEMKVEIGGHTDNVGSEEDNTTLSRKRAEAVARYFSDLGIAADRLTAVGYGPTKPVAGNDTPEGRAKNRRVEFRLHP